MTGVNETDCPRVAVLLAAYNGGKWIGEQIDTILAQRSVEIALFVSIDPGTDDTATYLHARAKVDGRINLLPQIAHSGCAARNFYRLVRDVNLHPFDYVALADQDDCWHADKLAHASEVIAQSGVAAYSGAVTAFWADGREKKIKKAQPQQELDFLFEAAGPGCTYVLEHQCALALQQFLLSHRAEADAIVAHDWLFYAFCRSRGYRWIIDSASFVRYRQHSRNAIGANEGIAGAWRRVGLLRSGWYRSQVEQISAICGMLERPLVNLLMTQSWRGRLAVVRYRKKLRRRLRDQYLLALFSVLGLF